MSHRERRSGHHNVQFEPRSLDERMKDVFDTTPDKLSLPKIKEDDKQPEAHYFDENDYQLHRKESYPQMHNFLKPMYKRSRHKRTTSVPVVSILAELDVPQNNDTKDNLQNRSETLPQISDFERDEPDQTKISEPLKLLIPPSTNDAEKVAFYIDEESGVQPDDSGGSTPKLNVYIPSSPSVASVEALHFQTQSPDAPIPSSVDRHKIDKDVPPSDKPIISLRATQISESQHKKPIPGSPAEENDNDKQKLSKKPVEHKKSHHKGRRASKQENPIWRQRIGSELDFISHHTPIIDESDLLQSVDVENIASHRFGEIRGARRYKIPSRTCASSGKVPGKDYVDSDALVRYVKKEIDHRPHEVFVQLNELHFDGHELQWAERARFIKYEEDVEEGADRWGKPHIASLSFHSLLSLRHCLEKGAMLLDLDEIGITSIYRRVVEALKIKDIIRQSDCENLLNVLMLHHSHMNDKKHDFKRRNYSYQNLLLANNFCFQSELNFVSSSEDVRKQENSILRRIPEGSEAIAVNIGAVDFLESPAVAFIRLARGQYIPSVTEVPIPVRFLFILIGPTDPKASGDMDYHEVGRSISALMKNTNFHEIAYKASERKELLSGINQYLDESIVLPPGDWERQSLLPVHDIQKKNAAIQRRKSVASQLSEAPIQGDKTSNMIGVTETLLLNSVCGIFFALLSGQPTIIVGVTGPNLLFDGSLFVLCETVGIEFLPLRLWMSIWILVIGTVVVAFDGSALVKFFTRFTEEIFSTLISLMYIYDAFYKLYLVFLEHPLISDYCFFPTNTSFIIDPESNKTTVASVQNETDSFSDIGNSSSAEVGTPGFMYVNNTESSLLSSSVPTSAITTLINNVVLTAGSPYFDEFPKNQPNTALVSTIMMLGTFFIAYYLRHFRNSKFLGRSARRALGDFGVPIAILFMAILDVFLQDTYTIKLRVLEGLSNSNSTVRGWVIPPMGLHKPFPIWGIFAAILPALLLFILFFMETEICQLIISKKHLKKGTGFHLDLILTCIMCLACGLFGGPWLMAATVRTVSHVSSLTVLSRTHAPGETPKVIDVKDQRVSAFMVYVLIGLSILMAKVLRQIPIAVLFGVFLYMGVSSMSGVQFLDRILLFFMPLKHYPDVQYVRKVKTYKMHLYTGFQCLCLIILWIVKSSAATLAFPFLLVLLIPFRSQLRHFFTAKELKALDGSDKNYNFRISIPFKDQQLANQLDCDEAEPDLEEPERDFYEEAILAG
ncbi:Anion exchange protein 2 [Nymphon striatum]|nr:Anion exchange protein 2 [Nymphon striatum]